MSVLPRYQTRVTLQVYDPAIPGVKYLGFTTRHMHHYNEVTLGVGVNWEPRMVRGPTITKELGDKGLTKSFGAIELLNQDGALDNMYSYGFDGRICYIEYQTDERKSDDVNFDGLLYEAFMEQPEFQGDRVIIKLRGDSYLTDKPLHTEFYAGSGGLEGNVQLTGQPKPLLFGYAVYFKPPLVDDTKLIYQITARIPNEAGFGTNSTMQELNGSLGTASQTGLGLSGTAVKINDGDFSANSFNTDAAVAGAQATIDYTTGHQFDTVWVYAATAGGASNWKIRRSDNGAFNDYADLATGWITSALGWNKLTFALNTARYWRIELTNTPGAGPWYNELMFFNSTISSSNVNGIHFGPVVDDGGVPLLKGPNYVSTADMNANIPPAGTFRVLPYSKSTNTGCYFRLNSIPAFELRCSAYLDPYDIGLISAGNIVVRTSTVCRGLALAGALPNFTQFDAATTAALGDGASDGCYLDTALTIEEAINNMMAGSMLWATRQYSGNIWHLRSLRLPSEAGTGGQTLDITQPDAIVKFERTTAAPGVVPQLPVYRVRGGYQHIIEPIDGPYAGAATADYRRTISQDYRYVKSEDTAILTAFPFASELTIQNNWQSASDEVARTDKLLAVLKVRRDFFHIVAKVNPEDVRDIPIGNRVRVQNYPRFGCTTSRDFMLLRIETDTDKGLVDLIVWG